MSMYPVLGLLEQVRDKMCTAEVAEEIINHYINKSCEKGYNNGVIDGRNEVLSKAYGLAQKGVNVPQRRDLTPLGMITFPDKNEGSESRFKKILDPIAELLEKKNHDYGNSYSKLRDEYGEAGFLVRIADKLNRLVVLSRRSARVEDEASRDTISDMIGYCTLELKYREERVL